MSDIKQNINSISQNITSNGVDQGGMFNMMFNNYGNNGYGWTTLQKGPEHNAITIYPIPSCGDYISTFQLINNFDAAISFDLVTMNNIIVSTWRVEPNSSKNVIPLYGISGVYRFMGLHFNVPSLPVQINVLNVFISIDSPESPRIILKSDDIQFVGSFGETFKYCRYSMTTVPTIRNVIFDLDLTLTNMSDKLFVEIVPILNYLRNNYYTLYICSHNADAEEILKTLGIHHYFAGFSCGYKDSTYKLVNLAELPVEKYNSVFFDDYEMIVDHCREAGWNMVKVKPSGVSWKDIKSVFDYPTVKYQWEVNEKYRNIQN
jgi:hypothetical protein